MTEEQREDENSAGMEYTKQALTLSLGKKLFRQRKVNK